jgi:hypothetical protein
VNEPDEQYSEEEAERRMNEALRRALNTPPKPQATVRRPRRKKETQAGESRRRRKPADGIVNLIKGGILLPSVARRFGAESPWHAYSAAPS